MSYRLEETSRILAIPSIPESSADEDFDQQAEYGARLKGAISATEYNPALDYLRHHARQILPPGTRFQIRGLLSPGGSIFSRLECEEGMYLVWYYGPWFPNEPMWKCEDAPTYEALLQRLSIEPDMPVVQQCFA